MFFKENFSYRYRVLGSVLNFIYDADAHTHSHIVTHTYTSPPHPAQKTHKQKHRKIFSKSFSSP